MIHAIILAAGKNSTMKSSLPKSLHPLCHQPLIHYPLQNLIDNSIHNIHVVVDQDHPKLAEFLKDKACYHVKKDSKSSAHALTSIKDIPNDDGMTLIAYGDMPLLRKETIHELLEKGKGMDGVMLVARVDDPKEYNRVIFDVAGHVKDVIQPSDDQDSFSRIKDVDAGLYLIKNTLFNEYFSSLNENELEIPMSKIIRSLTLKGATIGVTMCEDQFECYRVFDQKTLSIAASHLKDRINNYWLERGITLIDPKNTYISSDCEIGEETVIEPNVSIIGKTKIGKGCLITSGSILENAIIKDHVLIESSKIIDSQVGSETSVGPYAHLRMNTVVGEKCRIGNFVEFKKTIFGNLSRAAHLAYLGDCVVGEDVNIGCGVITANYDGKVKSQTVIGDHSFIGSNASLIAPIQVGSYAVVAAGSTVSADVNNNDLVIERTQVVTKPGYGKKYITKE